MHTSQIRNEPRQPSFYDGKSSIEDPTAVNSINTRKVLQFRCLLSVKLLLGIIYAS